MNVFTFTTEIGVLVLILGIAVCTLVGTIANIRFRRGEDVSSDISKLVVLVIVLICFFVVLHLDWS